MKKIITILLCLTLLLTFAGCKDKTSDGLWQNDPGKPTGGYQTEGGLWYIDYENPTLDLKSVTKKVTLSDGTTGEASMILPVLDVDLDGAAEVSELIKSDYEEKYGDYFKDPDDKIVKVSYTTSDENDILTVLIAEEITDTKGSYTTTYSYYYDGLADTTLNIAEFCSTNGAQYDTVLDALFDDEWVEQYKEETGEYPNEHCVTAIDCHGDLVFDLYCTNPDGRTQTMITVQAEDVKIDFSDLNIGA